MDKYADIKLFFTGIIYLIYCDLNQLRHIKYFKYKFVHLILLHEYLNTALNEYTV